jgi:hypothetical protein
MSTFGAPSSIEIAVPQLAQGTETTADLSGALFPQLAFHNHGSTDFGGGRWVIDVAIPGSGVFVRLKNPDGTTLEVYEPCIVALPSICGVVRISCIDTPNNILPKCLLISR